MKKMINSQYLYVAKDPLMHSNVLDEALGLLAEDDAFHIQVLHMKEDALPTGSIIFAANTWELRNSELQAVIKECYDAYGAIVLLQPNGIEINTLCDIVQETSLLVEEATDLGLGVFALQRDAQATCYSLRIRKGESEENITKTLVRWMKKENRPSEEVMKLLHRDAHEKLSEQNDINLVELAQCHVDTLSATICDKYLECSYYITSCHAFKGTMLDGGDDWYYICQYCLLNGAANYEKYWGRTRVKVNGTSWYVGQGEVALHYVDYYEMEQYFTGDGKPYDASLMYVTPVAINATTHYSETTSFNLGGTLGFAVGDKNEVNGNMTLGGSFTSGISFDVQDVTCKNQASGRNSSSVKWRYDFARAKKQGANHPQTLQGPGDLSHSTFTPTNVWIWKVPTSQRKNCNSFISELTMKEISTITRYSGSQSAKHVGQQGKTEAKTIHLPKPPLLAADQRFLTFGGEKETKIVRVAAQGDWHIQVSTEAGWCHVTPDHGNGEESYLNITCDSIKNVEQRETKLLLLRGQDQLTITVYQFAGKA